MNPERVIRMRTITLTDGTTYELDWCNGDKGIFNANIITKSSFSELAIKFSNPELTSKIVAKYGEDEENWRVHEGYTVLQSISFDNWRTGTVLVTLYKPERQY